MPCVRGGNVKVEGVIRELLPHCDEELLDCLKQEGITTADQLAEMDKDDLREVGFNIADRNRILKWVASVEVVDERDDGDEQAEDCELSTQQSRDSVFSRTISGGTPNHRYRYHRTDSLKRDPLNRSSTDSLSFQLGCDDLDELETKEEFWCRMVASLDDDNDSFHRQVSSEDVRENLLEQQYDCTPERISEVFSSVMSDAESPASCMAELNDGLQRFGIHGMREPMLNEIIRKTTRDVLRRLRFHEFESVLTRLKLAQLLMGPLRSEPRSPKAAAERLLVCDYSATSKFKKDVSHHQKLFQTITAINMKQFFFGHRHKVSSSEPPVVRWVHMPTFERELLLALTVKYTLHPLGVEDVIEQCPTKHDRYGCHYFIAIELLTTPTDLSGKEMVVVEGRHVTVFCAGPPLLDTVITIEQDDDTFAEEWPGPLQKEEIASLNSKGKSAGSWLTKLRERFKAGRSRLCERRADFLVYTIVDVCTDEIVRVTRAYTARVSFMENELRRSQDELRGLDSHRLGGHPVLRRTLLGEAAQTQLQLCVVARRVKTLRSVVRRILKDTQFCNPETSDYWADCEDHLDDAYDDAVQIGDRCGALIKAFERALDKFQERLNEESKEQWRQQQLKNEQQGERLNKILFVMTVGELCFAPVQFMAGVYGMNFVTEDGVPTMPELLLPNGYWLFWKGVISYLLLALCVTVCIYRRLGRISNEKKSKPCNEAARSTGDSGDSSGHGRTNWQPSAFLYHRSWRQDGQYIALSSGDDDGNRHR